ncbi:MAG TPA: lytic transglycosylase domain-containing protein [Acidimicrobiales bacterium]|nr:lytic transglycosylase domain-containing protein [Acidimicrobiales bacterium]
MSDVDGAPETAGRQWTAADRRRIAVAVVASLLLLAVLAHQAFRSDDDEAGPALEGAWPASDEARDDVPEDLLATYQEAAGNCPGLPWPVVAAIGRVETNHNREPGTSEAGATGPMQFLPATWEQFQADGDGDGVADIQDEEDAISGAVRLLCVGGADDPTQLRTAIRTYNQSDEYVDRVLEIARSYTSGTIEAP